MGKWEDLTAQEQNDVLKSLSVHILSLRKRIEKLKPGGGRSALQVELDNTVSARNTFEGE